MLKSNSIFYKKIVYFEKLKKNKNKNEIKI